MTNLEQVIETVSQWPPAERRRLREQLQTMEQQEAAPPSLARPRNETVEQQIERFRKAMKWIDEHRAEYLGQWVVLVGDRLISHASNARTAYQQAKAAGVAVPFLTQVVEQPTHFVDGFEICR